MQAAEADLIDAQNTLEHLRQQGAPEAELAIAARAVAAKQSAYDSAAASAGAGSGSGDGNEDAGTSSGTSAVIGVVVGTLILVAAVLAAVIGRRVRQRAKSRVARAGSKWSTATPRLGMAATPNPTFIGLDASTADAPARQRMNSVC